MKRKSLVLLICILVVALATSGVVFAKQSKEVVTINYNNIKITLDGKEVIPKDGNGNSVEPFILNGTTYLPVRAVGNALGLEVGWDATTKTVILTSKDYQAPVVPMAKNSVGQTYASDSYNLTVDGLKTLTKYNDYRVAESGNEFVEILVTVENTSNEEFYISYYDFEGYLDGYAISPTYSSGDIENLAGNIASGKKMQGVIVYQVPKEWEELEVHAKVENAYSREADMILNFTNPSK